MALTRQQKEQRVAEAQEAIAGATSVVFMAYDALGVTDLEELRDALHREGARVRVMPKRLLKRVLESAKLEFDPTAQSGQLAIVWGNDAVAPAKVLYTFAKKREHVQLIAGSLEGKLLQQSEILALAQLPTRLELLAQLVGTMVNPLRGLQTVLNGVQRQTVYVLAALVEQKQKVPS